jgi:hypothetical protein
MSPQTGKGERFSYQMKPIGVSFSNRAPFTPKAISGITQRQESANCLKDRFSREFRLVHSKPSRHLFRAPMKERNPFHRFGFVPSLPRRITTYWDANIIRSQTPEFHHESNWRRSSPD